MEHPTSFFIAALLLLMSYSSADATPTTDLSFTAPAPAPEYVNLKKLLTLAGPFHTFLSYLQQTQVLETFQTRANNSEEGITIFVPKDKAFSSLKKPSLSNLSKDQLKSLLLFHALPHFYTLEEFNGLSEAGPADTLAGGQYSLNFTDTMGAIRVNSGWSDTKISSSVYSSDPVAVYQVDKVLLPEAIFGVPPPPSPAPTPAAEIAPATDSPASDETEKGSPSKSSPSSSSSFRLNFGVMNHLVLAISGALVLYS